MYAANGSGIVLAEKGQFDIAKDVFTQVSFIIYCSWFTLATFFNLLERRECFRFKKLQAEVYFFRCLMYG